MTVGYAQMFERALDIVRGPHNTNSLMKVRPGHPDMLAGIDPADAGCGVHIDDDGFWELGASGNQIPFFLWQNSDSLDVFISGVSPVTNQTHFLSVFPTGKMTAFFAGGGFEFQTTAFVKTRTYLPNDPLTLTAGGLVTNQNALPYLVLICGYATWHENQKQHVETTGPVGLNAHEQTTLTFYGAFLPAMDMGAIQDALDAEAGTTTTSGL